MGRAGLAADDLVLRPCGALGVESSVPLRTTCFPGGVGWEPGTPAVGDVDALGAEPGTEAKRCGPVFDVPTPAPRPA